jgi:hypothetical protein
LNPSLRVIFSLWDVVEYISKYSNIYLTRCKVTQFFYLETALYISGCTTTHHQERKHLYLQHLVLVTPLLLPAAIAIPDALDTVVYAIDDWWWYYPKHVEQFPDKISCVTLNLVGYILEYSYDARTHER